MKYFSTNKLVSPVSLMEAVTKGLASDDGLFMPERIDEFHSDFFKRIPRMSFQEISFEVAKKFFGEDRTIRLRPHHFQFTEPSFEIDISCGLCNGTGKLEDDSSCRMCKEGWLELAGAGMVHPNVLKAGGIDPEKYSGFAFGWGVERCYSMKSGLNVDDLRLMYKNDLRFNEQF